MGFIEEAESRETSQEIIDAIWHVSGKNEDRAARIWDAPTFTELLNIWEFVTHNGLYSSDDYFWGVDGDAWAADLEFGEV